MILFILKVALATVVVKFTIDIYEALMRLVDWFCGGRGI